MRTLPTIHIGAVDQDQLGWRDVLNDENDPDPDDEHVPVSDAFIAVLGFDPADADE